MHTVEILNLTTAIVPFRIATISEGREQTYTQLSERSIHLAAVMHQMGVVSGDRVVVVDVNRAEQLEVYFAAMYLNAIYVPLNFRAHAEELLYPIQLAAPKIIFCGSRYTQMLEQLSRKVNQPKLISFGTCVDQLWVNYENLFNEKYKAEDLPTINENSDGDTAVLLFTAGTTGKPKAVSLTHHSFTSFMLTSAEPADPETEERTLLSLPLYHVAGLQSTLTSIYSGRTIVMQKQFEAREWLELVDKEKIQRVLLVPTMLKQVIDHPELNSYDLSSIELITYGGSPMPITVLERAISQIPNASFINAFGQTETGSTITFVPPEDHVLSGPDALIQTRRKHLESIGKALPDIDVQIIGDSGEELPLGQTGEISARGSRIMVGYWGEKPIDTEWLRTGDLGYMDEDGYIYLQGRAKDFIKRGGEMISPLEIENLLQTYPGVDECAVIGLEDPTWGERVVAVIVTNPLHEVTEEALLEFTQGRLARFKRPEKVIFVDALPRNDLGKVLKKDLKVKLEPKVN